MKETPATTSIIVSFGNKVPVFTVPAYELTPEFMQAQVLRLQVNAAVEDMAFDEMNSAHAVKRGYVAGEPIDAGMAVSLGEDGLVYRSNMQEPAPRIWQRVKKGDEVAISYIPKATA